MEYIGNVYEYTIGRFAWTIESVDDSGNREVVDHFQANAEYIDGPEGDEDRGHWEGIDLHRTEESARATVDAKIAALQGA